MCTRMYKMCIRRSVLFDAFGGFMIPSFSRVPYVRFVVYVARHIPGGTHILSDVSYIELFKQNIDPSMPEKNRPPPAFGGPSGVPPGSAPITINSTNHLLRVARIFRGVGCSRDARKHFLAGS